ncbi:3-beta hydroxysteroid dehydrogenase isomerase family protein [Colletotrichum musicola]|uniref:3-beta hydroxysteroid dehydrogenase isomerase family protein n=1 Tax=Colletotrichum musicola TaxID=2175873 RepID=A0A8H6NUT6_9PEZI|nr:3-beta hydroxysteroid dehydrogenase isomerase family protein [Colletotrichum musicola]
MANDAGPVGAFPPPPGKVPNFDQPEDLGRTTLVIALAAMTGIVTIVFGLRTYAKVALTPQWFMEDLAQYGEGYHEWEVTKEAYKQILRWLYVGSILYCPAAYFTKATLLLLEARVFAVYEKVARGVSIFVLALPIAYTPIMIMKALVCLPVQAAWDSDVRPAQCFNQRKIFISDMCLGLLVDTVILVLPIPLTFSLRMPVRTKVKVVALLSAGGAATGVSIFRLYKSIQFLKPADKTEGFVLLDITTRRFPLTVELSALELAIGLVCACVPNINLLVSNMLDYREHPNRPRTASSEVRKRSKRLSSDAFVTDISVQQAPQRRRQELPKQSVSTKSTVLTSTADDEIWCYSTRATSVDGRREGWLTDREGGKGVADVEADLGQMNAALEARRDWEEVWNKTLPPDRGRNGRRS